MENHVVTTMLEFASDKNETFIEFESRKIVREMSPERPLNPVGSAIVDDGVSAIVFNELMHIHRGHVAHVCVR